MKKRLALTVLLVLAVACRVPDLKPFSDATTEMATVVKAGYERTRATLKAAADNAGDEQAFEEQFRELDTRWASTRRALSALVAYADSLTALAEAGKGGRETMTQLTGALNDLASAVGAIPLAGTAAKAVEAAGAAIIEIQAARDIRKAVEAAADAVNSLAPLLRQNFQDLRNIHGAASRLWEARVQERSSILTNYYESVSIEEQRLEYLLNLINDYQSAPARLQRKADEARAKGNDAQAAEIVAKIPQEQQDNLRRLRESDPMLAALDVRGKDVAAPIEARRQQLMGLLQAQLGVMALLQPRYQQAAADLAGIREARATADRILEKAGGAVGEWQKAHESLQSALAGHRSRPSVAELLSITREIAALLE